MATPQSLLDEADQLQKKARRICDNASVRGLSEREHEDVIRLDARAQELSKQARNRLSEHRPTSSAPKTADKEAVEAYRAYVKTGEKRTALIAGTDGQGGYLVPAPLVQEIVDLVEAQNPIANDAADFEITGANSITLPTKSTRTVGAWVDETDARPATAAPTEDVQTLVAHEGYAYPEATQLFLDSVPNAERFITDDIAATIRELTGAAMCVGDGDGKPSGLFTAADYYETQLSGSAGAITAAGILSTYFALPSMHQPNARWYMRSSSLAAAATFAWPNLDNTPLVRWEGGVPSMMGKPVVLCDDAPAVGAANYPVAFGDLKAAYACGWHRSLTITRDPFTNKPYVGFYTIFRVGGCPWDPSAAVLLKSNDS